MKKNLWYFLVMAWICSACQYAKPPQAQEGVLDLRTWDFAEPHHVPLAGQWEFYWKQHLSPSDFEHPFLKKDLVKVPTSWTTYPLGEGKENLPAFGYATYRLRVLLPQMTDSVGLKVPPIWIAAKVWVNGKLVHQIGKTTTKRANFKAKMVSKLVAVTPQDGELEIVVQVSNFNFFISGLIQNFEINTYEKLYIDKELTSTQNLMWLGVLLIIGVYHLILFFFRRDTSSTLYFALICFLIGIRLIAFGEHYLYEYLHLHTSWYSTGMQVPIYYITQFALAPVGLLYVRSLYPEEANSKPIWASVVITVLYCLFIAFAPTFIFTQTLLFYQIVYFAFIGYLIFIIGWATYRKRKETIFQVSGILAMVIAGVNDGLHAQGIEVFGELELLPAAFGIFLCLQIFVIARRFSRAFSKIEHLNNTLELKVAVRTDELQQRNIEIEAQNQAVERANQQLAHTNQQITDSVRYARRIQKAILGNVEFITNQFAQAFIFFEPRDIVSGDFYWYHRCKDTGVKVIAAADCTGHGVPGAFMSVLGNDYLNEIVGNNKVMQPEQILYQLDKKIMEVLHKGGENKEKPNDGMDISILVIDEAAQKVSFAGAKNPLYLVRENQVHQIKGSKFPIGGGTRFADVKVFERHEFEIQKGDVYYIFSDGFQDQFGGTENRKYLKKRFRELLLSIHHLPMQKQQERLQQELKDWKKDCKQTDDILIIGLKY